MFECELNDDLPPGHIGLDARKRMAKRMAADTLKGLQAQLLNLRDVNTKLTGKATLEFRGLKKRAEHGFNEFKEKVKDEVKKMEKQRNPADEMPAHEDGTECRQMSGGWVLNGNQMEFLRRNPYLYCASAGSYLELLFLQKFWVGLAHFIPKFVAPSVITFFGLAINILCCASIFYFTNGEEAPRWTFLFCAVGLFLYQTLDALDGKQSSKVQNSPIEELTDHGCDAVSTVFVSLAVSFAAQLNVHDPQLLLISFLSSMIVFYMSHVLAHSTHTMVFGKVDVSEAQWAMIFIHLVTAACGQRVWQTTIPLIDVTLAHVICMVMQVGMLLNVAQSVRMIAGKATPLESAGIRIPRRTGLMIWSPLVPIVLASILTLLSFQSGLLLMSPAVFCIAFGFTFAKLTIKLVMTNVSRGSVDKLDSCLLPPLLLCVNAVMPVLHPYTGLLCYLVYSAMDLLMYFTYSTWDLRDALDAYVFSIKYPVGHPKNRAGDNGFYINGLNNEQVLREWNVFKKQERTLMNQVFGHHCVSR